MVLTQADNIRRRRREQQSAAGKIRALKQAEIRRQLVERSKRMAEAKHAKAAARKGGAENDAKNKRQTEEEDEGENGQILERNSTASATRRQTHDSLRIHDLLGVLDSLKHLKRTGWVRRGLPEPETVASHMYRMAVLAMALGGHPATDGVDLNRCVRMALVHDIGEALIGDLTPHCGVSEEEKHEREAAAVEEIARLIPAGVGEEWRLLWAEYEANESAEAKVVKQLDKFDMIAQALAYEQRWGVPLDDFFDSTRDAFHSEPFVQWAAEIREKRYNNNNAGGNGTNGNGGYN